MKKAFTLLELVFVVLVIGILSSIIVSNTKSNRLQEAAIQLISHIRYTQHLAMVDDKFNIDDHVWYKRRWQIIFGKSKNATGVDTEDLIAYTIFSDKVNDSKYSKPNLVGEIAKDPMNSGKLLSGGYSNTLDTYDPRANKKMNIGLSYGISDVKFDGGCKSKNTKRITFDHLGRPIKDSLASLDQSYKSTKMIKTTCTIILISPTDGNITIAIEPETGYTYIK